MLGLSTLVAQVSDVNLALSKPKLWGVGVNARHFGLDFGVVTQRPNGLSGSKWGGDIWPLKTSAFWLGVMRDPREMKVVNEQLPASGAFAIERVTHNLAFKYQVGRSISISERSSRGDLGLRINSSLQLPLNYSWPLYIWFYQPAQFSDGYTAVAYNPSVQDVGLIGGNAAYGLGFTEGKLTPGLGASLSLQAEWGSYKNVSNTLSLGVSVDRFVRDLPFWHRPEMNRNFFPSVFVTFAVGFEYGSVR